MKQTVWAMVGSASETSGGEHSDDDVSTRRKHHVTRSLQVYKLLYSNICYLIFLAVIFCPS